VRRQEVELSALHELPIKTAGRRRTNKPAQPAQAGVHRGLLGPTDGRHTSDLAAGAYAHALRPLSPINSQLGSSDCSGVMRRAEDAPLPDSQPYTTVTSIITPHHHPAHQSFESMQESAGKSAWSHLLTFAIDLSRGLGTVCSPTHCARWESVSAGQALSPPVLEPFGAT
jgi:hypothetical protein